jgi:hypothetical protein
MRSMKGSGVLALGVMLMMGFGARRVAAQAALPWYEPFDYAVGNLAGRGGWTQSGTRTAAPVQVMNGSLSGQGLPAGRGGRVLLANGTNYQSVGHDVAGEAAGGLYASFVLLVDAPGNATGDFFFAFSSAGAGAQDLCARVLVRQAGSGQFQIGLSNTTGDNPVWTAAAYPAGTPMFVVSAYAFGQGGMDDVGQVWINPPCGLAEPPAPDLSLPVLEPLAAPGRVHLRQGAGDSSLTLEVDELRVATSWAEATPAASAVGEWALY